MIDSRHYVGNVRAVCRGSFGWRDDHSFGWGLHPRPTVPRQPLGLHAHAVADYLPRPRPTCKLWGALEPYRADVPDLVKLIHWGADVIAHPAPWPRAPQGPARLLPRCVAVVEGLLARAELHRRARLPPSPRGRRPRPTAFTPTTRVPSTTSSRSRPSSARPRAAIRPAFPSSPICSSTTSRFASAATTPSATSKPRTARPSGSSPTSIGTTRRPPRASA